MVHPLPRMTQDQIVLECRTIVALSDAADAELDAVQTNPAREQSAAEACCAVTLAITNFLTAIF